MVYNLINSMNTSRFFAGVIMMLMNIGGKYISNDISESASRLFSTTFFRRIFVFCVAFVATRDILTSVIIVLLFIITFNYILNEKSNFCVLSDKYTINIDANNDGIITKDEIKNSYKMLNKLSKQYS